MKLKSPSERKASIRRKECVVKDCARPIHEFGFCRECLTEMDRRIVEFNEALKNRG
jgi:hypothetical protein